MTLYTEGFSRIVTSAAAPAAIGWSESCRAGFAPAENRAFALRTINRTQTLDTTAECDAN
jgi:hypothetical protein